MHPFVKLLHKMPHTTIVQKIDDHTLSAEIDLGDGNFIILEIAGNGLNENKEISFKLVTNGVELLSRRVMAVEGKK